MRTLPMKIWVQKRVGNDKGLSQVFELAMVKNRDMLEDGEDWEVENLKFVWGHVKYEMLVGEPNGEAANGTHECGVQNRVLAWESILIEMVSKEVGREE
jgi:hypothetical protein